MSIVRTTGCLLALTVFGPVFAQETAPQGAPTTAQQAPAPAPVSDRRLSELFYQLQVLQQEVQELRGLVEEQAYQLNRLARDQKEQYIDLDRRLAMGGAAGAGIAAGSQPAGGAAAGAPSTSGAAGPGTGLAGSSGGVTTAPGVGATAGGTAGTGGAVAAIPAPAGGATEREAYQQAFDLMKARQFDQSVAAFNRLVLQYPNGQYTPNAFYWLGELYLAQQNTEQARQSFMQVVNLYPDHPKIPDTLYKLGVTYHRIGDNARAMEYFGQVRSRFPQSSAAGLAASYAQEIQ
jgi:tol-pal system protein YbgF